MNRGKRSGRARWDGLQTVPLHYSHASVMQMDSSVRPIGGARRPAVVIN